MQHIILGSQSPRRSELLSLANIPFTVSVSNIEEIIPSDLRPEDVPIYLAELKGQAILKQHNDDCIIITADTIVLCNDTILGKPQNEEEAIQMLKLLSGNTHNVITGVFIQSNKQSESHTSSVSVKFKELTDEEIHFYVSRYEPYDKAGAYAIQEWIGAIGIEGIEGDYYSVMGLPIQWVYSALKNYFNFTSLQ